MRPLIPGNCQRCKKPVKNKNAELFILIAVIDGKISDPGNICKDCCAEVKKERRAQ